MPRSKSGASKSRPRWAAHTRIGNVWECPPRGRQPISKQINFTKTKHASATLPKEIDLQLQCMLYSGLLRSYLRSGVIFFIYLFFASLFLWLKGIIGRGHDLRLPSQRHRPESRKLNAGSLISCSRRLDKGEQVKSYATSAKRNTRRKNAVFFPSSIFRRRPNFLPAPHHPNAWNRLGACVTPARAAARRRLAVQRTCKWSNMAVRSRRVDMCSWFIWITQPKNPVWIKRCRQELSCWKEMKVVTESVSCVNR